jgi:hypothetical protein
MPALDVEIWKSDTPGFATGSDASRKTGRTATVTIGSLLREVALAAVPGFS